MTLMSQHHFIVLQSLKRPVMTFPKSTNDIGRVALTLITVLGCITILAAELILSTRQQSQTWNEAYHLIAGYRYWQCKDFGVNPEHPPLAKLIAALPLLRLPIQMPTLPRGTSKQEWNIAGREFLFGNEADFILFRARLAAAVFTLVLALLVFETGTRMFGLGPGILATVLMIFEPNLLAHGMLVTTDAGMSCCLLASVYAFYRYVKSPAWFRLIECGILTGLALAVKHSGILAIAILGLLILVEIFAFRTNHAQSGTPLKGSLWPGFLREAGSFAVIIAIAVGVLWAFYGFRYQARPLHQSMTPPLSEFVHGLKSSAQARLMLTLARARVLPESYLYGMTDVLMVSAGPRPSFLLGRLYPHGRWFYFPAALAIKSTLGFLLLLVLACGLAALRRPEVRREVLYLALPPAVYLGTSMTSDLNIGIRHILPVYPFLLILVAAGAWSMAQSPRRLMWIVPASLLLFHVLSSLRCYPNYLAYSNELWGGPARTYRVLTDTNVDWGQGLIATKAYLERRRVGDCWLAYFGSADPDYYHLPCKLLPDPFAGWWGKPVDVVPQIYQGTVLVSATELSGAYWGPGELNPYDQFWKTRPVANLGGSILVFEGRFDLALASALSHTNLAFRLASDRKLGQALEQAKEGVALAPRHMATHFTLGYLLAQQNQKAEARREYQTALSLAEQVHPEFVGYWVPFLRKAIAGL
jgi:hypothetical protein